VARIRFRWPGAGFLPFFLAVIAFGIYDQMLNFSRPHHVS
jgi:hypothetical protein